MSGNKEHDQLWIHEDLCTLVAVLCLYNATVVTKKITGKNLYNANS